MTGILDTSIPEFPFVVLTMANVIPTLLTWYSSDYLKVVTHSDITGMPVRVGPNRRDIMTRNNFVIRSFFILLPWRSDWPHGAKSTMDILLFLLRWLQNLYK